MLARPPSPVEPKKEKAALRAAFEVASSRMRRGGGRLAVANQVGVAPPPPQVWNGPYDRRFPTWAHFSTEERRWNGATDATLSGPEPTTRTLKMTPQDPKRDIAREGIDAKSTRQGRPGLRVLSILIASLGGAAVLLALIWAFSQEGLSRTNANNGDQPVDARAFDQTSTPPSADAPTGPSGASRPLATGEAPDVNAPTRPSN